MNAEVEAILMGALLVGAMETVVLVEEPLSTLPVAVTETVASVAEAVTALRSEFCYLSFLAVEPCTYV